MSDEDRLTKLEEDLAAIKQRNARVTAEKAWERSPTRIALICAITYLCAALLLLMLGAKRIWLDALVPTLGFFLSSLSVPIVKDWWISRKGLS